MTQFIAEFRTSLRDETDGHIRGQMNLEADTLQLAQREVERLLRGSNADEVVLYQAVSITRAERNVSTTSLSGQKVVIGSAYVPNGGEGEQRA